MTSVSPVPGLRHLTGISVDGATNAQEAMRNFERKLIYTALSDRLAYLRAMSKLYDHCLVGGIVQPSPLAVDSGVDDLLLWSHAYCDL